MFKDEQYFECEKDCAVFVGLDRLSDSCVPVITKTPSSGNKNSKNLQKQKSVEQQQKQLYFKGDRLMAFDDDGGTVHGTVKWTGGTLSEKLVGIETVSQILYIIFKSSAC